MFKNWFRKPPGPPTRLSEDEAVALARTAAADCVGVQHLSIVRFESKAGSLRWLVSSATVGRSLLVVIDDATARVVEIEESGVR